jgi:hypothetical protein
MKMAKKTVHRRKSMVKRLLGMTAAELRSAIGIPYVSYSFRDEEILVFEKAPVTNIALHKGVVVKCDTLVETRKHVRVKPAGRIPVIANGNIRLKGVVRDISVTGISISHSSTEAYQDGDLATVSFLLPIDGSNRFLEIPCVAIATRNAHGMRTSAFIYDVSSGSRHTELISRYVALRMTQNELGLEDSLLWCCSVASTSRRTVNA